MAHAHLHFLQDLADGFCENRLADVADHFVYPMPLYAGAQLQVYGAAATLAEGLAMYRDAARDAGVCTIVPRIVAQGLPVRGYSHMWVEWDHLSAAGHCLRTSQVHYILYQSGAALFPKIELVDYKVTAFPQVMQDMGLSATA